MAWAQGHQDYYAIFDNRSRVGRTEEGERRVAGISILASSQAKTIEGSNRTDEPTLKCGIWFEAASLYISLWLRLRMSANSLTVIADRFALSASSMFKSPRVRTQKNARCHSQSEGDNDSCPMLYHDGNPC
jgi:hypothetical protein